MDTWKPAEEKPLGMNRCKRTDCDNGLHCFLKHKERRTAEGTCWACGAALIDWERLHKRDILDVAHTVQALKQERIRHEFWCTVALTERARNYALKRGRDALPALARKRIRTSVGGPADAFDGRRTPWEAKAHILHFAQHATATCCRNCIAVWHYIPRERQLTESEVDYFTQLLMVYVDTRMPTLPNNGGTRAGRRTLRKDVDRKLIAHAVEANRRAG